jgi:pimeloyl-ACP methyl ester carboxylesterase
MDVRAVHLVGHSVGGAVAAELAASGDVRAASLTLLAPAGLGPEIHGAFIDGFLRAEEPASLQPWLGKLVADPSKLANGYAAGVLRERRRNGLAEAQAGLARSLFPNGTQAIDIRETLQRSAMPTRVVWGLADAIIPASHLDALADAIGVNRLRAVGHMPQVEAPDLVARIVLENCRAAE